MLTFTYKLTVEHPMGGSQTIEGDKDWHVGEHPPNEFIEDEGLQVLSVMADGKELAYIITEFKNIPYTYREGRACVWRGDLARFIFDNL